ncbi:MAG: CCA tRNA nucleotidyltransferase [Leptospiraceae bacterium]|nr:CCA tRNA nucleotidyltransferase [Leptospiraceae bacterium]
MFTASQLINQIPENYKKDLYFISSKINEFGYESYIIGGSVRDLILGKNPHEYDIATSAHPEEIKKIFKRVIETGIQHGTVTILLGDNTYEVTTYRKDMDYTDGRRPDKIEFGASLSEDMKRRDFTMNAIALDLISETLIDENNGIEDINNKIIRTIGDPINRFGEDGLRPIRAIRFLSTLGFKIESKTYNAIYLTRNITEKISKERFHDELNKIISSQNPFIGLYELITNKIFELFTNHPIKTNPNLEHLKNIEKLEVTPLGLRLAFLLDTIFENSKDPNLILKELRYSKTNIKDCLFYLDLFEQNYQINKMNIQEMRQFLSKLFYYTGKREIDSITKGFFSYLRIFFDDKNLQDFETSTVQVYNSNSALILKDLVVNGNKILEKFPDIDKRKIGGILQTILNRVLEEPEFNKEETIYKFIENLNTENVI